MSNKLTLQHTNELGELLFLQSLSLSCNSVGLVVVIVVVVVVVVDVLLC